MLAAEENYAVGKLDGIRRTYYDNGFLEKAQTWRNGFQVGEERIFFPNGKRKEENKFNDAGVMIESKIYDERGRKIEDLDAGEIAERNRKRGGN
jgi:antitoxin component YwqK of YwqJK toxin-antitoxin module